MVSFLLLVFFLVFLKVDALVGVFKGCCGDTGFYEKNISFKVLAGAMISWGLILLT